MTSELKPCEWCGSAVPCSDGACPLKRRTTPSADALAGLKRFGLVLTLRGIPDVEEQFSGEYVLYSEAAAVVAELKPWGQGEFEKIARSLKTLKSACNKLSEDENNALADILEACSEAMEDNTLAVPDVPELVPVGNGIFADGTGAIAKGEMIGFVGLGLEYKPDDDQRERHPVVRHDQAAAMLAAKEAEKIERINHWSELYSQQYQRAENAEAKSKELEAELANRDKQLAATATLASELSDKLAQIKAQKIIGYFDGPHFSEEPREGWLPLFAAPVDQTAEIERLREALKVQREAAATYCWERYKNRPPLDLSDAACFTSHEWQKIGDAMDAAVAALSGKEP